MFLLRNINRLQPNKFDGTLLRSNQCCMQTILIQGLYLALKRRRMATYYENDTLKTVWWINCSVFTVKLKLLKLCGMLWKRNTSSSIWVLIPTLPRQHFQHDNYHDEVEERDHEQIVKVQVHWYLRFVNLVADNHLLTNG